MAFRLIARLDIKAPNLIKTIRLEGVRVVGDPEMFAYRYSEAGIDELFYLDAVASLYGRNSLAGLVEKTTENAFVPVTVGGGIRSVEDARTMLRSGADKIAINTAAVRRPELLTELAEKLGSQCVVLQLDAKQHKGWRAHCDGGREPTGRDAIEWAKEAVERGAGEIIVTSIDREGTRLGPDIELGQRIAEAVRVPVVLSGGIDTAEHLIQIAKAGLSGAAIAGALHYGRMSLAVVRKAMLKAGIVVR